MMHTYGAIDQAYARKFYLLLATLGNVTEIDGQVCMLYAVAMEGVWLLERVLLRQ